MTLHDAAFEELAPPPRLLMGPGPINADPRVLRAMSAPMLGQFDPQFRAYMVQTMALYRALFQTQNEWTFVIDGTARAGIEAVLVSVIEPGDRVLVPVFGRFGNLKVEIAERCGGDVRVIEAPWGTVFQPEQIETALRRHRPKLVAICQGDTSTTMLQPLADIGRLCRQHDALLYVDATASLGGNDLPVDAWQIDAVSSGLQKCLAGPPGVSPLTVNDRVTAVVRRRRHVEKGLLAPGEPQGPGPRIASNYFDLAMLMDYWDAKGLNHHTEATTGLYAARECARLLLQEGLPAVLARHALAGRALVAACQAMGLSLFGDIAHKMANVTGVCIPEGIDGERVRAALLQDFNIEIGAAFGPMRGKVWRIGSMGYCARKDAVLVTVQALEAVLAAEGFRLPRGAGVDAALSAYRQTAEAGGSPV
ncbi:MAG: alanine--glyoxylate aminotransferase family protein [Candidatus Methylomirabilota bacterium]